MHKDGAADGYLPVPTEFFRVPRPADGLRGQRDPNPRGQEHRDPDGRRSHVLHVDGDDRLDDVEKPHRTAVEAVRVGGHGFGRPGSACTRSQLDRWGMEVRPIPVDGHGLDVAALAGSRGGRRGHPGPPVPHRRGAGRRPVSGADGVDAGRWPGRRGRLRRRASLRQAADGRPAGGWARTAWNTWAAPPSRWRALRLGWLLVRVTLRGEVVGRKRWSDITSPALACSRCPS